MEKLKKRSGDRRRISGEQRDEWGDGSRWRTMKYSIKPAVSDQLGCSTFRGELDLFLDTPRVPSGDHCYPGFRISGGAGVAFGVSLVLLENGHVHRWIIGD